MTRRVVVHDFSGHPFQLQLSRELAHRGDSVLHLHCGSYVSGKGNTGLRPSDPPTFGVESIDLGGSFVRYELRKRRAQEREYARLAIERIDRYRPDVLISCNVPLFAHAEIQRWAQSEGIVFVFWHQDFYGTAMREAAAQRLRVAGDLGGRWFERTERRLLAASDAVVGISPDFARRYRSWGLDPERFTVVENWAPLEELPARERANDWARRHGLADTTNLLYSGTLGMKHNPELLAALAESLADRHDLRVVVVSEGAGADWLAEARRTRRLENLVLLPFQPFDVFPSVIAAGDVLVAILEHSAGGFSVPSKVLTYLCAERPLLVAMPADNLAAVLVRRERAGVVVDTGDVEGFVAGAHTLVDSPDVRARMGRAARGYAEQAFDIGAIADRFEEIIPDRRRPRPTPPPTRITT